MSNYNKWVQKPLNKDEYDDCNGNSNSHWIIKHLPEDNQPNYYI